MGSGSSNITVTPTRQAGEASPFYWACRNGDIATVQKMLPNMTYEQINQVETNGSTALHAASFYNHPHIVRSLLDSGCSRTAINYNRATAYQEASTDEIRALFKRPASNRFIDEHLTDSFQLVSRDNDDDDDVDSKDDIPDDWVKGHTSADSAHEAKFMLAMANSSSMVNSIVKSRTEAKSTKTLDELVSIKVPKNHTQHNYIKNLFDTFLNKTGIGPLLTMYTVDSPLYTALQDEPDSFTVLLYFHLNELQDRAFQGRTYRGATMTQRDINAYRWALKREGSVLETRIIQSMSKKESIAQNFVEMRQNDKNDKNEARHSVLLTLVFPEKCPTAINLAKTPKSNLILSAYEHEEEVLLLPFTLFTVNEIKIDSQSRQCYITLTNVPTPKSSLLAAIKHVKS